MENKNTLNGFEAILESLNPNVGANKTKEIDNIDNEFDAVEELTDEELEALRGKASKKSTNNKEDEEEETKLYTKADWKAKNGEGKETNSSDLYSGKAKAFLEAFGGKDNIEQVNNCATRLRISVKDEKKVGPDIQFKAAGAHGVVRNGKAFQVIVGLSVPQVRESFENLMEQN